MLFLVPVHGGGPVFSLSPGSNRLGRADTNDVIIANPRISREHAVIVVEGDRITISDLQSRHGTAVNEIQVVAPTGLRLGDRIRLGDLEFALLDEPEPAAAPAIDDRVSEPDPARLSAPEQVHSRAQLDATAVRGDSIQSPTVTSAMMVALTEAGNLLTGNQPLEEIFAHMLQLVEQVIPARRILILTADTPSAAPVVRASRPAAAAGDALVLSRTIVSTVLDGRRALLLNDIASDERFIGSLSIRNQKLRAALVAPLFDNSDVIGLLYADDDRPFNNYESDHLRAFTLLANLIAIKITNTRLQEAEQAMIRLEEELATAGTVQRSMLRASLPVVTGYALTAFHEPCQEVGGDLYDFAWLPDGRLAIVVGDVSGKGIGAALLMSNVMACLRLLYKETLEPSVVAGRLHEQLLESAERGYFVTAFFGILDWRSHRLDYVNAGHNPPLLITGDAAPVPLTATGVPLGLVPGVSYRSAYVEIPPDSLLCLFSDGIPEAWTGTDTYGDERFVQNLLSLRPRPLEEVSQGIMDDVRAFLAGAPPTDDITLCLVRREGVVA